ncbi:peptidylprolyl isomerase [Bythopirellula polymerisocia]|uniref:peptidylprolyl isomerase n=1 Tax=Bythopirellula polymerisocia TaxID=2528003 RepID=A0A5C6D319_9BACT|nr:peptidylprolyl isomerase [Bythopirellula polymerisocia]TWU30254.1 putative peptidyl-prolyl cis-trans isomerase [Bythopirellula polymerisocia]
MRRFSWIFCLFMLSIPRVASSQEPAAHNSLDALVSSFEQARNEWVAIYGKIKAKQQERAGKSGDQLKQIDTEINQLKDQAAAQLNLLVESGLAVYKADPKRLPEAKDTLVSMATFHVLGDASGNGGDQYERALPLVKSLLDAGAGAGAPQLWLLGAVSAVNLNDFSLAKKYFAQAEAAGVLSAPPQTPSQGRLLQLAQSLQGGLPQLEKNWQLEQRIREAEALADDLPRVQFTTAQGDIVIELFENEAPQAVANFLTLVKKGYYDGVPFHRVLPGFMAQGGDPTGSGSGGPGYSIRCECHGKDYRKHFRGSLSMAHAGRNTGGSQFFLTFVPTSYLDGRHTVFGRVIEGMDVAASIKRRDPDNPGGAKADKIVKAKVLRDRGHEYKFEKLPGR